jgi:hypothetical protein
MVNGVRDTERARLLPSSRLSKMVTL